jgi:ATP-dependent DNA ligase
MPSDFIPPCIPTRAIKPPAGIDWVHEIKHDGYRLQVRREGDTVRLFTRRGYDWSGRYPPPWRADFYPGTMADLKRRGLPWPIQN